MQETNRNGSFPRKWSNNIMDDRAYTLAMAGFYLAKIRRDEKFNINAPAADMSALLGTPRKANGTQQTMRQKNNKNPFANRVNPFSRR